MRIKFKVQLIVFTCVALLSGCGGGGEDFASQDPSAYAKSANSFDIKQGWALQTIYGFSKTMRVSGSCSGDFQLAQGPITQPDRQFDLTNRNNVSQTEMLIGINYGACTNNVLQANPWGTSVIQRNLYESLSNYYFDDDTKYGYWETSANFPSAAKVGETGQIGAIRIFNTSTNTYQTREVWTYTLEARTATTAVFNLIKTSYNATDLTRPVKTEVQKYQVLATNELQLTSIHWEDETGFVFHAQ
jgi:hypothetical protein